MVCRFTSLEVWRVRTGSGMLCSQCFSVLGTNKVEPEEKSLSVNLGVTLRSTMCLFPVSARFRCVQQGLCVCARARSGLALTPVFVCHKLLGPVVVHCFSMVWSPGARMGFTPLSLARWSGDSFPCAAVEWPSVCGVIELLILLL